MPTLLVRCMLFLSSYFPLALIFFLLFIGKQPIWAIVTLAVGLAGLIIMVLYFLRFAPRLGSFQTKVTGMQRRDADVMSYIASYLIPFVAFPLDGWQLNLMGYHLYEITVEKSEVPHALITHHRVALGETIHLIDIGDGMFLEKRVREQ